MTNKKYFTKSEILQDIKEVITDFNIAHYDEIVHEAFLTNQYIIGRHESEKALEQYGTFKAIGKVVNYELEVYGVYDTRPDDPEAIANTLYFLLGVDTLYNESPELREAYCSALDCAVSEEMDRKLINAIDSLIAGL